MPTRSTVESALLNHEQACTCVECTQESLKRTREAGKPRNGGTPGSADWWALPGAFRGPRATKSKAPESAPRGAFSGGPRGCPQAGAPGAPGNASRRVFPGAPGSAPRRVLPGAPGVPTRGPYHASGQDPNTPIEGVGQNPFLADFPEIFPKNNREQITGNSNYLCLKVCKNQ